MANDVFDEVISALHQLKAGGQETICLSEEAKAVLASESAGEQPAPYFPAEPGEYTEKRRESTESSSGTTSSDDTGTDSRSWEEIKEAVNECRRCPLHKTRTRAVFGEGDPRASVLFIGEGPGYYEDQSGEPFVGRAGKLLTKMIQAMQFTREEVFITNVVKCRPPGNRNPENSEVTQCKSYLNRQIDLISPSVIVLLGAVPMLHLLDKSGITKIHGEWFEYRGVPTLPTFHPSYLLRSPARKRDAWEDLQKVMLRVGKDPEKTVRVEKS